MFIFNNGMFIIFYRPDIIPKICEALPAKTTWVIKAAKVAVCIDLPNYFRFFVLPEFYLTKGTVMTVTLDYCIL